MSFLAKHAINKVLLDDALKIGAEAKKNKLAIDGTLGQFKPFKTPDFVKEILANSSDEDLFAYSPSSGGDVYAKSTIKHLGITLPTYVIATPGGTGALSASVNNFLDKDEILLIPTPCWKPYFDIAKHRDIKTFTYDMFDDNNNFNLKGFIETSNSIVAKQNKLVFILNDPCQNPTGYSLTIDEMNRLIAFLNSLTCDVVMIYDCAYLDLKENSREVMKCFEALHSNVLLASCVSYSKTFQVYGQRIGALALSSINDCKDLYDSMCYLARNTWSNTNKGMITLINKVMNDEIYHNKLEQSLTYIRNELAKRSELFISEAKMVNLPILPYDGGYFISIPSNNPSLVVERLKKVNVYVLPVCNIVRVAICGIAIDKIKGLAKIIKDNM